MRKILITNDDGIDSEGMARLAKCARKFGEVWIVAPDSQRSGASHSVMLHTSFEAWKVEFPVEGVHAYACTGQPADCVRIGVLNIVPDKPDVVLCGINYGFNVASDIQYSATAGAAFEAAFQKIHTIAFSEGAMPIHEVADEYLEQIIAKLLDSPLGQDQIWNVNFPECPLSQCKGILWDRKVSKGEFYKDRYNETPLENGKISFMVEGVRNWEIEPDTDLGAILSDYVSVGTVNNIS